MWLVADRGVRLVAGVIVGLIVARYLGPGLFGELNATLALVAMAVPLAELGLDAIVRRRLITSPGAGGALMATTWKMRLSAATFIYASILLYVAASGRSMNGELLLILGLLVFQPASLTADLWLQSNLRSRVTVVTSWVALAMGAGCRLALVWWGAGLLAFGWVAVVEFAVGSGLLIWAAKRSGLPRMEGGVIWKEARELLACCWMLLASKVAVMLYMKLDLVMIAVLAGEREAGMYAAALRISEIGYVLPVALASSALPRLLKLKEAGGAAYARGAQAFYDINAAMAYAVVVPIVLFAQTIIEIAYGAEYADAGPVLRWHACAAVFVFLGVARSQLWVSEGRYALGLCTTLAGAACNVGLNLWWIPAHGALGAAWATIVAYGVAAWGGTWLVRDAAIMQTRALLLPVIGWRYLKRK